MRHAGSATTNRTMVLEGVRRLDRDDFVVPPDDTPPVSGRIRKTSTVVYMR